MSPSPPGSLHELTSSIQPKNMCMAATNFLCCFGSGCDDCEILMRLSAVISFDIPGAQLEHLSQFWKHWVNGLRLTVIINRFLRNRPCQSSVPQLLYFSVALVIKITRNSMSLCRVIILIEVSTLNQPQWHS